MENFVTYLMISSAIIFILYKRSFIKLQLFIISFQPLFFILAVKFLIYNVKSGKEDFLLKCINSFWVLKDNLLYFIIVFLSFVPIIVFWVKYKKSKSFVTVTPYKYEKLGENLVSYVMTYIVPLTTLSKSSTISDYIGNIILFIIIMCLYIRLNLMYINPVLILFSYNIYKVFLCSPDGTRSKQEEIGFLITKKSDIKMDNLLKSENPILNVKILASDLFFETYTNRSS